MHSVFKKEKDHDANCIASEHNRIISEKSRHITSILANLPQVNRYIADITIQKGQKGLFTTFFKESMHITRDIPKTTLCKV